MSGQAWDALICEGSQEVYKSLKNQKQNLLEIVHFPVLQLGRSIQYQTSSLCVEQ